MMPLEHPMADEPKKVSDEEYKMALQLETSLLGWLRTSLALMGFGFVIARFGLFLRELAQANNLAVHTHPLLTTMNPLIGTALILMGMVVLLISV
jgi:inner membrane protein YidH